MTQTTPSPKWRRLLPLYALLILGAAWGSVFFSARVVPSSWLVTAQPRHMFTAYFPQEDGRGLSSVSAWAYCKTTGRYVVTSMTCRAGWANYSVSPGSTDLNINFSTREEAMAGAAGHLSIWLSRNCPEFTEIAATGLAASPFSVSTEGPFREANETVATYVVDYPERRWVEWGLLQRASVLRYLQWSAICAALWCVVWLSETYLRARRLAKVGRCSECGYLRTGLPPLSPCPECGKGAASYASIKGKPRAPASRD